MFDFFGSKKNKEKRQELEENIAQIREKVQQEEQQRRAGDGGGYREAPQEPAQPEQPPQMAGQNEQQAPAQPSQDQEQETAGRAPQEFSEAPGGDDWEPETTEQLARNDTQNEAEPRPPMPRQESAQQETQQEQQTERPQPEPVQSQTTQQRAQDTAQGQQTGRQSSGREQQDESRMSMDDVPQPPEVKDLDIPDIDKGPLFITVNKFKNALTTLSEMKQMVNDLESNIGSLENTLEEDRETEEELRKILDTTITDTEIIQGVVTPEPDE
jgi:hypothetical protein